MRLFSIVVFGFFVWGMTPGAFAFNPPEDKNDPLTVRIEGPDKITATETPVTYRVVIVNSGSKAGSGTLALSVIDGWRVTPEGKLPFTAEPGTPLTIECTVTAAKATYNALYPIHAFVECEIEGTSYAAHPVLIVNAQVPNPPRPAIATEWRPIALRANSSMSLLRLPVYRPVIQVFDQTPVVLDPGWQGTEGRTRGCLDPSMNAQRPDAREALGVHPPYHQGLVGTLTVEYPLVLPDVQPIRLNFAYAIRDSQGNEPLSDGVTYRVRVLPFDAPDGALGEILFEKFSDAKTWQDAEVDLGRFAGQTVRLQLETDPGPKRDPTCDQCYWATPVVTAGTTAAVPAPEFSAEKILGPVSDGTNRYDVRVRLGQRGLLDAEVAFLAGGKELSFRGFRIRVAGDRLDDPNALNSLVNVTQDLQDGCWKVRHKFQGLAGAFDLLGELRVDRDQVLRAKFWLENAPEPSPWKVVYLEDVALGPWSEKAAQVYAGVGNVLRDPAAFELGFDGHQLSSSFVGFDFAGGLSLVLGVDVPPDKLEVAPGAKLYTLHAPLAPTMTLIPAANVWDGVKVWRNVNGLKPAGGVAKLAGRFVFDLWGGNYGPSRTALERAFRYGLTDSAVVWHNWQRWGYDYRLPDIYPPNPGFGTLDEFRALADCCKARGVIFAPHDNYIDFYPDAEGYSYQHIAFTRHGDPIRGWLNEGRAAQAYRPSADALRPFLERNLKLIRDNIAPTGYFIDVWSSIGLSESWTQDGRMIDRLSTRKVWGESFAWIRDYLGDDAPQISESGHDQLIGYLDGAQTNHLRVDTNPPKGSEWMVWKIACADNERIPWLDMAHHDRFVLHGAGYDPRYRGGLDGDLHGIYSDDYIATEVMTGHPGMVAEPFSREVVRKYWLLHNLMRALALKRIDHVEFADGNLHRQHIRWEAGGGGPRLSDGGEVWVNRGVEDWTVASHTLPQYGFYARAGKTEIALERRDGVIVEWSRSPECIYVNARPLVSSRLPVSVTADSVEYTGDRTYKLALHWNAEKPLEDDLRIYVHFVDSAGKIAFQADHDGPVPTTQWKGEFVTTPTGRIPEGVKPGDSFELGVGLWNTTVGRKTLRGMLDNEQRVRLGTLTFEGSENKVTGFTWKPIELIPDPKEARFNTKEKPIDFGGVITNGACRFTKEGGALLAVPLPEGPDFTATLDRKSFPLDIHSLERITTVSEDGMVSTAKPLRIEGKTVTFDCERGVFAYRLSEE